MKDEVVGEVAMGKDMSSLTETHGPVRFLWPPSVKIACLTKWSGSSLIPWRSCVYTCGEGQSSHIFCFVITHLEYSAFPKLPVFGGVLNPVNSLVLIGSDSVKEIRSMLYSLCCCDNIDLVSFLIHTTLFLLLKMLLSYNIYLLWGRLIKSPLPHDCFLIFFFEEHREFLSSVIL